MQVPQFDLTAQYAELKDEVLAALERVCASQRFVLGPEGEALERELASYCQVPHAIGCASGSDALLLSLVALGAQAGDEVVTSPFTFFSTAGAVARLGAQATFVDIEPRSFTLDPARLETHLENLSGERRRRTRAVIAVHLFGHPAEMEAINEVAEKFELPVIEDAAQAIGADYRGHRVGSLGRTGCFSFYPTKNLAAIGDAGLVTTADGALADRLRALRQHGSTGETYHHDVVGWNSRLDELQAAVLRVKLKHLERWTEARRQCATHYDRFFLEAGLADAQKREPDETHPVVLPYRPGTVRHVFHQYVIRARNRDALRGFLRDVGVETQVYYPVPLHLQPCFQRWGGRAGDCPEAERAAGGVLALPMFPELTEEMQQYVVNKVAGFYRKEH
jgi:dTDP-4-amino-4,6-dideoxygalactose transaminase